MPIMIFQSSGTQPRKKIKIGDDDLEVAGKQSYHQEIKSDCAAEIPSSDDVDTMLSLAAAVPGNINTDHHHHHHHHHHEAVMIINLAKFRNEIIDESSNFLCLGIINDRSRNYKKDDSDDHERRVEIKIGDNDAKHDELEAAACREFLKEAHEDILLEIFIRLPDSRSAIRSAIVCHNWHSLISHNPRFIPRFISYHHQHQDRYPPPPYTIIFRKDDRIGFDGPQCFQPICKLFSEDLTFCTSTNFLNFMPSSPLVIRGSCNDLLLVSPGPRWSTDLYICNPITKQFVQLLEIPRPHDRTCRVTGLALVCMPDGPTNKFRFKVVVFQHPIYDDHGLEFPVDTIQPIKIFCSESRKWEMRHLHYPRAWNSYIVNSLHAAACNGILYWLEYERHAERIISLDLSNSQCCVIDLPDGCSYDCDCARLQIGGVRVRVGDLLELRLLEVVISTTEWAVDLKVWKLNNNNNANNKDNWVLVHDKKKLKKPKYINSGGKRYFSSFVHPTNGDVVFMVWGQKVFQYNLEDATTTCEMIDELQEPLGLIPGYLTMDRLLPFPVVHQNWPTLLPS